MKTFAFVFSVLLVSQTMGFRVLNDTPNVKHSRTSVQRVAFISPKSYKVGVDLCPTCIQFTEQALDTLLNIILNSGVVGTCGALCNALAQKTGSQALGAICNILCDIEGVEEFIKLIQKADLDPIYFCEEIKQCPVKDDGDAKIEVFSVQPKSGPQGVFQVQLGYNSKNGTGTGEIVLEVLTVDKIPVESGFIAEAKPAGPYNMTFNLKAEPDPDCDPTQGPCEEWLPGDYTIKIALCNGECGSKHPHSQIYDESSTSFTITN